VFLVGWMTSYQSHGPALSTFDPPDWNSLCHWEGPPLSHVEIGRWMVVATSTQGFEDIHEFQQYLAVHRP